MTAEDRKFYSRRMQEELEQAIWANDPGLRHLHAEWARLYQRRLEGEHAEMADSRGPPVSALG